ncbi:GPW/gp25 family protein [Paenibacillus sp. GbtcB18]|uniref:GPW/gp25 family protein n=1 Tax=Paenibacillus sp. GbtcB18 TaxID=2824763 RepID=UPI001C2F8F66|nr:GPW/gp25 family protein [Paenibacillus sp. GbtcB18]
MIYTVDMRQQVPIDFAPASLAAEVEQNIRTILSTPAGAAPLSRDIGIPLNIIDEPLPVAQARLTGQVMAAILTQEPRASVQDITFHTDFESAASGRLVPVVRYTLKEEEGT